MTIIPLAVLLLKEAEQLQVIEILFPHYFHFSFNPWRRRGFVFKPGKILGNLFKYIFLVLFFCLLPHGLAVRVSLPFHIFLYLEARPKTWTHNCLVTRMGLELHVTGPTLGLPCHAAPAVFRIANRGKIDQSVERLTAEWEPPGPGQYSVS